MKTRFLSLAALLAAVLPALAFSAPAAVDSSSAPAAADSSAASVADSVSGGAVAPVATTLPASGDGSPAIADSAPAPRDSVSAGAAALPADSVQNPDGPAVQPADDFADKILLFPPQIGEDVGERDGLAFVLVYEAEKRFGGDLREHSAECAALGCAEELGRAAGARRAIVPQIRRLGSKLFLVLSSVDFAEDSEIRTARETFAAPEEFATAARRAFEALESPDGGAAREITVENVTSADGPNAAPRHADAARYFGLKFGMMYPLAGTYSWVEERGGVLEEERIEVTQWEFGVTYWIFLNTDWAATLDLALRGPNSGPDRYQFVFDVGGVRLFDAGDVSPFVGFGVGLQAGPEDEIGDELTNRHMGFSFNANAGLFFLRTYNFSLFLRGLYGFILNDDFDQKIAADFGMLLHANPLRKSPAPAKAAKAASTATEENGNPQRKNGNPGGAILMVFIGAIVVAALAR